MCICQLTTLNPYNIVHVPALNPRVHYGIIAQLFTKYLNLLFVRSLKLGLFFNTFILIWMCYALKRLNCMFVCALYMLRRQCSGEVRSGNNNKKTINKIAITITLLFTASRIWYCNVKLSCKHIDVYISVYLCENVGMIKFITSMPIRTGRSH